MRPHAIAIVAPRGEHRAGLGRQGLKAGGHTEPPEHQPPEAHPSGMDGKLLILLVGDEGLEPSTR